MTLLSLYSVLLGALAIQAAPLADQIFYLPGLDVQPSFKQYSGYLNVPGGKYFHYWFVESQQEPTLSPVVLWLNGGPGCSSLLGLLTEHGPFLIQADGSTLTYNQYSWNKIANVLYLESPAGVGFSYSDDQNYETNDTQTALDNYMALKDFFRLFPEFSGNDFYITGESYGGFYAPCLAVQVSKDHTINLKGIAIGNGITSYEMNYDSLVYYLYYHGIADTKMWTCLQENCCENQKCKIFQSENQLCERAANAIHSQLHKSKLNVYNLYQPCVEGGPGQVRISGDRITVYHPGILSAKHHSQFAEMLKDLSRLRMPISTSVPCVNESNILRYMNNPDVLSALHVLPRGPGWDTCSTDVFMTFDSEFIDVRDQFLELLKKKYRMLLYSGDFDMACNFLGIEWFVNSLGEEVQVPYHPWWYPEGEQLHVGGFVKQYPSLTLMTVKGAGHMVPTDNPAAAFAIFRGFINNEPF